MWVSEHNRRVVCRAHSSHIIAMSWNHCLFWSTFLEKRNKRWTSQLVKYIRNSQWFLEQGNSWLDQVLSLPLKGMWWIIGFDISLIPLSGKLPIRKHGENCGSRLDWMCYVPTSVSESLFAISLEIWVILLICVPSIWFALGEVAMKGYPVILLIHSLYGSDKS